MNQIINQFNLSKANQQKQFAMLIDPDKVDDNSLLHNIDLAVNAQVDFLFVGGSLLTVDSLDKTLSLINSNCKLPVILFPGSAFQINNKADGLFLLSLISGRNAELLIGQHVNAAPFLKASQLEIMPTGYILIDGGAPTTVSYISNTLPIPANKPEIAACTALAGEMLGLKLIYMDAGSGAKQSISPLMVSTVRAQINLPIIVGGGIQNTQTAVNLCNAGADCIVIGNAIEKNSNLIVEMAHAIHQSSSTILV
jgi:phosphoglycerol geranylgeranyltransferase